MLSLVAANAKRVGYSIDVIEPRCYQGDLQDCFVIEAGCAQHIVILLVNHSRVFSKRHYVIKHHAFLFRDRRRSVVPLQRFDEIFV